MEKRCFTYCGDDACDCEAGPRESIFAGRPPLTKVDRIFAYLRVARPNWVLTVHSGWVVLAYLTPSLLGPTVVARGHTPEHALLNVVQYYAWAQRA